MNARNVVAIVCLAAGVPLAAWGLAGGGVVAALLGLVLVLVFVFMAWAWIAGAQRPMGAEGKIKPSPNAAWAMKDQPVGGQPQASVSPPTAAMPDERPPEHRPGASGVRAPAPPAAAPQSQTPPPASPGAQP